MLLPEFAAERVPVSEIVPNSLQLSKVEAHFVAGLSAANKKSLHPLELFLSRSRQDKSVLELLIDGGPSSAQAQFRVRIYRIRPVNYHFELAEPEHSNATAFRFIDCISELLGPENLARTSRQVSPSWTFQVHYPPDVVKTLQ